MLTRSGLAPLAASLAASRVSRPAGRVDAMEAGLLRVKGLSRQAALGDLVQLGPARDGPRGEVLRLDEGAVWILPDTTPVGLGVGTVVSHLGPVRVAPHESWLGRIIDPQGRPLDGRPLLPGPRPRRVTGTRLNPVERRPLGPRLETRLASLNTFLPLVRGQRMGIFAGAGVGKTSLLGHLARHVSADAVVVALIGERGRELRPFVESVLGAAGLSRAVLVVAPSDSPAGERRRCVATALTIAEHLRDEGQHVLLLADSITRFAQAHREIVVAAGEPTSSSGYPPSTTSAIADICERAGPGAGGNGDITAIFTVLVAGSDLDEPISDILRGLLDGHIVLDRTIAERGRFPAIDVLRSVSRALPEAASNPENVLLTEARKLLGAYERAELMIRSGLYSRGADPVVDRAVEIWESLDDFISRSETQRESFRLLAEILSPSSSRSGSPS